MPENASTERAYRRWIDLNPPVSEHQENVVAHIIKLARQLDETRSEPKRVMLLRDLREFTKDYRASIADNRLVAALKG